MTGADHVDTLITWLFVYFVLTIPGFLVLALIAGLTRSPRLRLAAEVVVLSGCAALLVVVVEGAFDKPLLWLAAALLVAVLVFGVTLLVRTRRGRL
ncbi:MULTISPECIES: hypothetical protein [unclassified Micromonospora]|uniref:hypothetical protein n=1 Tax=unclassified Micromonospora TaxID=2617518 RepID=UPI0022BE268F|nr:hypothetical protein [Micromonospora sp. AKA38]GHJ17833.1 hypothetical protein TPA0908_58280 [Micromonospora sp. AKA38]